MLLAKQDDAWRDVTEKCRTERAGPAHVRIRIVLEPTRLMLPAPSASSEGDTKAVMRAVSLCRRGVALSRSIGNARGEPGASILRRNSRLLADRVRYRRTNM